MLFPIFFIPVSLFSMIMQRLPQATNLLLLSVSLSILSTLPWCLVCGLSSISLPSPTISPHECELKMVARHWRMGFFNNRRGKNWSNRGLKGVGLQRWGRKKYGKYNSKIEGKVAYSGMKLEFLCILCSRLLEMDLLGKKIIQDEDIQKLLCLCFHLDQQKLWKIFGRRHPRLSVLASLANCELGVYVMI